MRNEATALKIPGRIAAGLGNNLAQPEPPNNANSSRDDDKLTRTKITGGPEGHNSRVHLHLLFLLFLLSQGLRLRLQETLRLSMFSSIGRINNDF